MNRLARIVAVRPGEGRLAALVAALFATVEAGRGFGEIAADTLFLSRFGAGFLPYLYVGLGLVSLVVAVAYGAAVGRFRRGPLFVVLIGAFAAVLLAERLTVMTGMSLVLPALWLTVYVIGAILMTILWTLAGWVLDARQAKRLFPLCTSAGIAGGFAGTLLAGPLAAVAGVENLVLVDAALLVVAAGIAAEVSRRHGRPTKARSPGASFGADLRVGFDYVRGAPLMRLIAVAYVLFAVLFFSVSFPVLRILSETYPSETDLATALGLISAAVTAVSFVVSLVVANRVYARFGVTTAALVLPVVYLAGFGSWLVQFGLGTAVGFRVVQQVTQRGISNAAWSAFFNVVPGDRRAQVLAFMDGVPGQVGIAVSGVLLLAAGSVLAMDQIFVIGAAAALACTLVVLRIRRLYARGLVSTLRTGLAEQVLEGGPGLATLGHDPSVVTELRTSLRDAMPAVRRLAADVLGRLGAREASDDLAAALADGDATVRAAVLRSLTALGPGSWSGEPLAAALSDHEPAVRTAAVAAAAAAHPALLEREAPRLAGDPDPFVRAELSVALVRAGEEDRPHALLQALLEASPPEERVAGLEAVARLGGHAPSGRISDYLTDPSPVVRAAAVRAVAVVTEGIADPMPALGAALADESRVVRLAAAHALNARGDGARGVALATLATGSGPAQEAALVALDGYGQEVREPLLEWARTQVERAGELRRRGLALAAARSERSRDGRSVEFLEFLVARREMAVEERLLLALRVLGAPEASGLIRRCLRSPDSEVRAQALEALDSIGDRRLGGSVAALLESDLEAGRADPAEALRSLIDDPDPWVRGLALRGLAEHLEGEWATIVERAAADADPVVRTAAGRGPGLGGATVPEAARTLDEIERMLFLRRVPLFSELIPEDLQRIAATATERSWGAGEAVVREGDLGDEMVVIVEGSVRVVRDEGGQERLLRRYEAGDHIGELALLRERPRAATVIAEDGGIRGLVIGGDGLKSILRERPEAAMAMLATLAERLSNQ